MQTRRLRRFATVLLALVGSVATIILLVNHFDNSSTTERGSSTVSAPKYPLCSEPGVDKSTWPPAKWRAAAESKYGGLLEDKFTIALSTFHRPREFNRTLQKLLSTRIPSLHEIVVVWNNLDENTPEGFISDHGVAVRYRKPPYDSLNVKLFPDAEYRTKAILLSDDDVYYHPEDIEFVFQMWREFGKDRITGALARCASVTPSGEWDYNFCSPKELPGVYSIVLTNLAFTHISFLDYYFSDHSAAVKIRKYVQDNFNCEDIGLNFVTSMLTRSGPLLVRGRNPYVNLDPAGGLSRKPGHLEARSKCLNTFAEAFQCMPLMNETGRLEHGVKHNSWYGTLWNIIYG